VKAAYDYFHQKFDVDLKQAVLVFKQARFFNPAKIGELKHSCTDIDDLKAIPGLRSGAILEEFKDELPTYMATADGVSTLSGPLRTGSWSLDAVLGPNPVNISHCRHIFGTIKSFMWVAPPFTFMLM